MQTSLKQKPHGATGSTGRALLNDEVRKTSASAHTTQTLSTLLVLN